MQGQSTAIDMASIEAISVVFAAALVWLAALVQHLTNVMERGTPYVIGDRSVPPSLEGFFGRATRTLNNNIESALMWVPPVVVILMLHHTSWLSHLAAQTYIATRVVYAVSYWFAIPLIRSLSWFVGMICCATVTVLAVASVS
jgi:uncharacterized MAPEG superfamily protein